MLDRHDNRIGHIKHIVTMTQDPVPARLIVPGQKLEPTQPPVIDRVVLDIVDKTGVGDNLGPEHGHPACKGKNFFDKATEHIST